MNKEEAHSILLQELAAFRMKTHAELSTLVGSSIVLERKSPGGTDHQLEIDVLWDDPRRPQAAIRVIASIDDGGFVSAFAPLTGDFSKTSAGDFLGE
jgi:hypothetical protein